MNLYDMKVHPAAELFPLMSGKEFDDLAVDIQMNGQVSPCTVWNGILLDGRNRWQACVKLGLEPDVREFKGSEQEAIAYIVSRNLKRRQLTPSQKAEIAAELEPMIAQAVAKTKAAACKSSAEKRGRAESKLGHKASQVPEIVPEPRHDLNEARTQAAKATGANPHYVADVKAIRKVAPDLLPKIRSGEMTVPEAKRAAKAIKPVPPATDIEPETKTKHAGGRKPIADPSEMERLYRHFDAKEVARRLGVSESTVYDTAHKLGWKSVRSQKTNPVKGLLDRISTYGEMLEMWSDQDDAEDRLGTTIAQYDELIAALEFLQSHAKRFLKILLQERKEIPT